ncbi:MAG TPA: hypothetical protein VF941_15960 [Clostridia bacterium]
MDNLTQSIRNQRRPKGIVHPIATNYFHLRSPLVTACWSASFPGFGHIILGSYVKGFLLILWEIIVNTQSKVNLAILYSFIGKFDQAKSVIDKRWVFLYVPLFIYAVWDSYRSTVDINKLSILADHEKSPIIPVKMNFAEINYLDKRNPWLSVLLSVFMPGTGHLYTHRLPTGFFVLGWWIAISYFSHLFESVYYTAIGAFNQAIAIVDPEWLLFMPSIIGFTIYDAYVNTVEYNKLFEVEQSRFLKDNYQTPNLVRFSKITKNLLGTVVK